MESRALLMCISDEKILTPLPKKRLSRLSPESIVQILEQMGKTMQKKLVISSMEQSSQGISTEKKERKISIYSHISRQESEKNSNSIVKEEQIP